MNICVYGAGSIGCYLGGRLLAGGASVSLVGRARTAKSVNSHGLHLTDLHGADVRVGANVSTDPAVASTATLILVTVKSAATESAGAELASVVQPGAVVISFQNGLDNADILRRRLPGRRVLAGMVPFNVAQREGNTFHQGTSGQLMVERHPDLVEAALQAFIRAGLPLQLRADMPAVQWAKLLLNLNNSVNALSGLPLKAELSQRAYRRCLALAQREGLKVLKLAGLAPAKLTPVPPRWVPALLGLPDFLFRILANRMLAIDPLARSSMQDDLQQGRTTEIDWLNGEVVRLGEKLGAATPVNRALVELVRAAEKGGRRAWPGGELLAAVRRLT